MVKEHIEHATWNGKRTEVDKNLRGQTVVLG